MEEVPSNYQEKIFMAILIIARSICSTQNEH